MSEPLKMTIQTVIEKDATELERCMLLLRIIRRMYKDKYELAVDTLSREKAIDSLNNSRGLQTIGSPNQRLEVNNE